MTLPRKICPKIEKPQALTNIEGIIEKSQALMVARCAALLVDAGSKAPKMRGLFDRSHALHLWA